MITDTEKRAHKRAEVQAEFYWQGKPYPLKNISVGGFSLNSKTQIYLPSNSLSGLIVFENEMHIDFFDLKKYISEKIMSPIFRNLLFIINFFFLKYGNTRGYYHFFYCPTYPC